MSPHLHRHHDDRDAEPPPPPRELPTGPALRATVYLGESDRYRHHPVFSEIVHRARRAGLAGASVFHGVEGFGAGSLIHTSRLLDLTEDLPVAVVIVDSEERIRGFLPELREVAPRSLITLDPVEAVPPRPDEPRF
ncbi:DUF190 domain-containing protein [Kitasatospora sp. NPDC088351]|uniref:DUF190 domain-containing protein n=1 Tax=unclassified Kitasatospora TaxID=2633591 RepID=UPI0034284958